MTLERRELMDDGIYGRTAFYGMAKEKQISNF